MTINRTLSAFLSEQSANASFDGGTLFIDAVNGRVNIGTINAPTNKNTVTSRFVVSGAGVSGGLQVVRNTTVGGGGAQNTLSATRGSDVNSYTVLQNGDGIGTLNFSGADGTQFVSAAHIQAQVDGTPGTDNMPARLVFGTTPSGGSTPTERMRITAAGEVGIGTSSPVTSNKLTIDNGTSAYGLVIQNTGGDDAGFKVAPNGTVQFYFTSNSNGNASMESNGATIFRTNNAERMRITSSGNVGVGTSSPISKVSVATSSNTSDLGSTGLTIGGATTLTSGNVLMLNFTPIGADSNRARAGIGCEVGADWGKGNLTFYTKDTSGAGAMTTSDERMRITSSGYLYIGDNFSSPNINPSASASATAVVISTPGDPKLEISRYANPGLFVNRTFDDGDLVRFFQAGTQEGSISVSGTTISYNAFLGSHWSQLEDGSRQDILRGTVLESVDEMCVWPDEQNDRLPRCKISDTVASTRIYGVFLDWDNDDQRTNDLFVAAVGAGYIRMKAGQNVKNGDLVESAGDGTAQIQSDNVICSSTIGKITSSIIQQDYADVVS